MTELHTHADRFKALGHPARLGILRCIVQGAETGTPVGEIQQRLGIPASTLSHHLATLTAAGLLSVLRRGTFLLCRADFQNLRELTGFLWADCCSGAPGPAPACAPPPAPARTDLDVEED
jgi:DNA-binding transcriptional ArsR family regulator